MNSQSSNTPEQNYQQGIHYFSQNNFKEGINCFKQAAIEDYNPAIKELGLCFLHGIGIKPNLNQAIKYFKKSKSQAESQFELMKFYFFGYGVTKNLDIARKLLILAVQNNYNPAINLMALCYIISGDTKNANILLNKSFSQKDMFASHLKKLNLLQTDDTKINFIQSFQWPGSISHMAHNELHKEPHIFTIKGLLHEIECEYIKYIASPFMRESMTVDPNTKQFVRDTIRTSYSATIDWLSEDPVINLIMQKVSYQFDVATENSEVLHVLHYSVGEEYKPHFDFFGGMDENENFLPEQQRVKTICLYLNDVESGGDTSFPNLNLTVSPSKGTAVFFENINPKNKQPYIESLHAGQPILQGEKWLATLWIRGSNTNRGPHYE